MPQKRSGEMSVGQIAGHLGRAASIGAANLAIGMPIEILHPNKILRGEQPASRRLAINTTLALGNILTLGLAAMHFGAFSDVSHSIGATALDQLGNVAKLSVFANTAIAVKNFVLVEGLWPESKTKGAEPLPLSHNPIFLPAKELASWNSAYGTNRRQIAVRSLF